MLYLVLYVLNTVIFMLFEYIINFNVVFKCQTLINISFLFF
jgi:hypothetical protein